MSTGEQAQAAAAAPPTAEARKSSLLDQVITATKQTERVADRGPDRRPSSTRPSRAPSPSTRTSPRRSTPPSRPSTQSSQAARRDHAPPRLPEAGRDLARAALPGDEQRDQRQLKIKVLNVSKRELFKDLDKAVEFDQSQIFKKLYENEFGTPGGEPYGALIGDYEFTNHPEDIDLLSKMSQRGGGRVLSVHHGRRRRSCSASRAGTELSKPRDLEKIFDDDRVHQVEVVPRLGRLAVRHAGRCRACWPGCPTAPRPSRSKSSTTRRSTDARQASRAARRLHLDERGLRAGHQMTDAFAKYGCCTAIRGAEGGGKVEGLPATSSPATTATRT